MAPRSHSAHSCAHATRAFGDRDRRILLTIPRAAQKQNSAQKRRGPGRHDASKPHICFKQKALLTHRRRFYAPMEPETALNACFVGFDGGIQQLRGEDTAVILPAIFGLISAVGIVGNVLVIVILIHDIIVKKSACGIVLMLVNLSGTDLVILAVCTSTRAITYHNRTWTLGHLACRTAEWFQHGCLAAKSLTLAVMSRARYNFDCDPHLKIKRVLIAAGSIWALGLALPVAEIIYSKLEVKGNFSLCVTELPSHSSDFMRVHSIIYTLVVYAFPVIFSAVCHVRAIFRVTRGHGARAARRTESRLALLSVTAANALLLLPGWTVWLWLRHSSRETCEPPAALLVLAQVCTYLTSASSPAILLTMLVPLRDNLAWIMCRGASWEGRRERSAMAVGALDDGMVMHTDALGRPLPDVQYFWNSRRNTAVPDNTNPFPWEGLEHCHAEL
ncbi:G-protein coupled receptor 151 protein [Pangasianodon hypophthalmus]|uniref:G-protein coupled receptor 151 protein n=1 Tax=Pangasianodon hypophthalmus TaxID=310915 RepID=UPI002307EEB0|nr:G-protein coupled receptor 151 protein [Pangasianodon hypophthalmus]